MDIVTQILSGLVGVAIVLMIAPRVLALNQGKILQNIAIWVGVFLILALVYQTYGPGKLGPEAALMAPQEQGADDGKDAAAQGDVPQINEGQGFVPPREE